ncbi:alpha/beta hydrolase [Adhaeribacter soli]|uniref:Lysophospholipase n=1 Tax=Adhaeribacter soli TaxID=2607655 RepID=A0A5N1IQC1_9BACT|nr:alpha/beta fold hydrolase [Adhaeribacter soli]KAA9331958.1 lysophospholipase [Adhaeribacter soli]
MKSVNLSLFVFFFTMSQLFAANTPSAVEKTLELTTRSGILKGTLLRIPAEKPIPVVLIISGSGPTDKNGNNPMMQNNHLKMVAEDLSKAGIASLRYDKRGIGENAPAGPARENDMLFDHLVNDAADWATKLKEDPKFSKVIILGHSEGSLIGMMAAQKAKADAFISVAGAGQTADKIIREQLKGQPKQISDEALPILEELAKGKTVANVNPMFAALFRESVQPYLISWMKYDPQIEIAKLTMPVFLVQGTTDLQVTEKDARLLAAANKKSKLVLIEGMNHVLKTSTADPQKNMATYNNAELPLAPALTPKLTGFIASLK